ncbi:MAG: HEAT repeat domain-containing protein [Promethearchaeota archaeon]|nr:MAG: HEAT repeat domain-containing protein [Candidatus Lokiarchaeota archaeon]
MAINLNAQPEEIFKKRTEFGIDQSIHLLTKIIDTSNDKNKRMDAVKYLGLASKEAPNLKQECFDTLENIFISEENKDIKCEAAKALGRLKLTKSLKPLLWGLENSTDDSQLRLAVLKAIRKTKFKEEVINLFIKELDSSHKKITAYVKDQLLVLNPELLVNKLIGSLGNKNLSNKVKVEIIKLIGYEISSLNATFKDSSYIKIKYPEIISNLINQKEVLLAEISQILKKEDRILLESSITILNFLKEEIKEDIIKLLLTDNFIVKKNAIIISGKLELTEAVDVLVQNLDSLYNEVSLASIEALGEIGEVSSVPELLDILNIEDISFEYSDIDMKFQIMDAVKKIYLKHEKNSYDTLYDYLNMQNDTIRESVAFILGEIGKDEFVAHLIKLLNIRNVDVKKNVIIALGKIGHLDALDHLVEVIQNKKAYWLIKKVTTDALFNIFQQNWYKFDSDDKELNRSLNKKIATIIEYLREEEKENYKVKLGLIKLLETFGDERALDALLKRVNDFHRVVRIHASNAIKKIEERLELLNSD